MHVGEDLSIEREKQLYNQARDCEDPAQLRKHVSVLYGRILELADEILALREQRADLLHQRDAATTHSNAQEAKVTELTHRLACETDARASAERRATELEDTTRHLTGWNGMLEEQNAAMTAALRQHHAATKRSRSDLEAELIGATEKQIHLRRELDLMEEEGEGLRVALRESMEIQETLRRENAILKSRLYGRGANGGGSRWEEALPSATGAVCGGMDDAALRPAGGCGLGNVAIDFKPRIAHNK